MQVQDFIINVTVNGQLDLINAVCVWYQNILMFVAIPALAVIWAWRHFKEKKDSMCLAIGLLLAFTLDAALRALGLWHNYADSVDYLNWVLCCEGFRGLWFATLAALCYVVPKLTRH
ncbi:MAG: hypothetical protein Q4E62_08865 [Sutterellaceae bacterium]|nr:hypothetical protein [Sutterellaceae bacterium]